MKPSSVRLAWVMSGALAVLAALATSAAADPAADGPADGAILERRPYAFAEYDSVPALANLFPKSGYDAAMKDPRFVMERLVYSSDGLKVVAYVYGPKGDAGNALPVVVFNRGGYVRPDIGAELLPMCYRLALRGFRVVAPLYRGSDGGEGHDEMGGTDLDDLMNVAPLLRRLGATGASRVFLYGESRGGMMVFQALRDGFPARAAAVFGAFTDFNALVASNPKRYDPVCRAIWPEFERQRDSIATRRSAIRWAESLGTPLLIMHGGADGEVLPAQSTRLATRLRQMGYECELHVYPGDGHVLKLNASDRDARAATWFRRYVTR